MNPEKKKICPNGYDIKTFRAVKHGTTESSAYCRKCDWNYDEGDKVASIKGRQHAAKTMHTVDVYRETHTEFTSYVKDKK